MFPYWPHKILIVAFLLLISAGVIIKEVNPSAGSVLASMSHKKRRPVVPTATPTVSFAPTATPTVFLTATPTKTISPTVTPTRSPTPTATPTKIPTKAPSPTSLPTPLPTSASAYQWGAYTGWSEAQAREFETKVGHNMNLVGSFVHWGNEKEFPADLANFAKSNGKTLVIYWEAMDYNNPSVDNNPLYNYDSILAGKWDSYFVSFAQSAKAYGSPVILIPFEEANGDWYPWSATKNGNTVTKYIFAFRYLRGFFKDVPNVKFAWDVNSESVPDTAENSISAYYPGNDFTDYVGVNGFNFNTPWLTFDQVFNKGLTALNAYNKPIYIFSMACADGTGKAAWIADAMGVQMPKYPNLKGWIWFNENKEKDWRVWSDANSLSTFVKYIQ